VIVTAMYGIVAVVVGKNGLAATYKASSLCNLPAFTHHLASFNDRAGRTAEGQRLNALYAKKQTRSNAKDSCTSPKDASKSRKLSHSGRKRLQTG
jgi:hypothetical protein